MGLIFLLLFLLFSPFWPKPPPLPSSPLSPLLSPKTQLSDQMRNGISSRASCWACNALAGLFLSPVYSKEMMTMAVNTVCTSFRLQSPRVCSGIVDSFKVSVSDLSVCCAGRIVQCSLLPTCCLPTLHGLLVLHLLIRRCSVVIFADYHSAGDPFC